MGQYKSPSETVSQHLNLPESYHINKWNNLPQGIPIRSCCLCEWGAQEIIMLWILYRRIPLFSWFFFYWALIWKKNLSYSLYLGIALVKIVKIKELCITNTCLGRSNFWLVQSKNLYLRNESYHCSECFPLMHFVFIFYTSWFSCALTSVVYPDKHK